jgi:hypothetical protein
VVTIGLVVELEDVSLATLVSEVIDRVRREAAIDGSGVLIRQPADGEPQVLSPQQSLREARVKSGDRLILTPSRVPYRLPRREFAAEPESCWQHDDVYQVALVEVGDRAAAGGLHQ